LIAAEATQSAEDAWLGHAATDLTNDYEDDYIMPQRSELVSITSPET
jgi:hypothetical protein